jgi:hypothetical protein
LFLCLISFKTKAQNFSGISSSNYGGIHSVDLNPANAVDSRYSVYVNFGSAGLELQNNYARWDAPYSLLSLSTKSVGTQYLSPTSGLPIWNSDYYKLKDNLNKVKAYVNAEVRGPAVQFSFPKSGIGVAAGINYRVLNSFGNTSPTITTAILTGTKNPAIQNIPYNDQTFLLNIGGYNEFYFTLGKVLAEDGPRFIKVGGSLKRLTSNLHLSLQGDAVDYEINPTSSLNESQNIILNKTDGVFFHASSAGISGFGWLIDQMKDPKGIGNGFSVDFGVVYEFRPDFSRQRYKYKGNYIPDPLKNKYLFKLGASLRDIGFLRFASSTDVKVGMVNSTNDFIAPSTFYHLNSTSELVDDIEQVFNIDRSKYLRSFNVLMPANLVLHGDYRVKEGFYLSAVLHQYLLSKKRLGPIGYSGIAIIPRFEKRFIEFAFPIAIENDYANLNIGATMRAGPLFIGLDNVTGLINLGNPRGLAVHAGLSFGFNHKRPKNESMECYEVDGRSEFSFKKLFIK